VFAEDFAILFSDFATPATLAGTAVRGIFDNAFSLGQVGIGMAATQPTFTLPSASVLGEAVGQSLVIGANTFYVAAHEPDATGVSRLLLERA
jgi:hypothetical protein